MDFLVAGDDILIFISKPFAHHLLNVIKTCCPPKDRHSGIGYQIKDYNVTTDIFYFLSKLGYYTETHVTL